MHATAIDDAKQVLGVNSKTFYHWQKQWVAPQCRSNHVLMTGVNSTQESCPMNSLFYLFLAFFLSFFLFRFPLSFHVWEYLVGGSIAFLDLLLPFCMLFFSFHQSVIVALYFEISIGKLLLFLSFPEHIPSGDMTRPAYHKPDSQGTNRNDVEENMQYTRETMRRTGPQNQTPAIRLGRIEQQLAEQKQSGASKQGSGSTNPLSNQNTGICPRRGGRLVT